MVTLEDKRKFIIWLVNHPQFAFHPDKWLLHSLASDNSYLNRIRFVTNLQNFNFGLEFSSRLTGKSPLFSFYENNREYNKSEVALAQINNLPFRIIHIKINYVGEEIYKELSKVLSDKKDENVYIAPTLSVRIDQFLENVLTSRLIEKIKKEIDSALDNRDFELASKLKNEMDELEKRIKED